MSTPCLPHWRRGADRCLLAPQQRRERGHSRTSHGGKGSTPDDGHRRRAGRVDANLIAGLPQKQGGLHGPPHQRIASSMNAMATPGLLRGPRQAGVGTWQATRTLPRGAIACPGRFGDAICAESRLHDGPRRTGIAEIANDTYHRILSWRFGDGRGRAGALARIPGLEMDRSPLATPAATQRDKRWIRLQGSALTGAPEEIGLERTVLLRHVEQAASSGANAMSAPATAPDGTCTSPR